MSARSPVVVAVLGIALAGAGVVVVGRPGQLHRTRTVHVPAATATAATVVEDYLDALDAHDCRAAVAMSTSRHRAVARRWCEHVGALRDRQVRSEITSTGGVLPMRTSIGVRFDLRQRWLHHDDLLTEGRQDRGYYLVQGQNGDGWHVDGEGP